MLSRIKKLVLKAILLTSVLAVVLLMQYSCANTTAPPMGGIKDTIPPVLLKVLPDSGAVDFPLKEGKIELRFDEYVVLKEPQKNLYLSPPLDKRVETKIRGKSIIASFPSQLDSSVTYTLNFGNSIVDNNEGNQFNAYVFPFSTGKYLDSMMISGTVYNAATLMPANDATVAVYKNQEDSAVIKTLPSAMAKTDKFGYFVIRNIPKHDYRVFAFKDNNGNNKYDPENEEIAFSDSIVRANKVLVKGMPEIVPVSEKDTLTALGRPSQIKLYMFKEDSDKQYIREAKRLQSRMFYLKFSAPGAQLLSLDFNKSKEIKYIKEFNIRRDSLVVWLTDTLHPIPDTLKLTVNYMKTDSLLNLTAAEDEFSLVAPKPKREEPNQPERRIPGQKRKRTDLLEFTMEADPVLFEQKGFVLEFPAPLKSVNSDSLLFRVITPRGDTSTAPYNLIKDSINSRYYTVIPRNKILQGHEYTLLAKRSAFTDIYKHTNDSLFKSVKLPQDEKLSKLSLDIKGVKGFYIVELTNITRDKVFRSYFVNSNVTLEFPYLQKGKYSVKITEDINGNSITDTGNLLNKRQPEKVRLYTLPDGSAVITIPESTELVQTIDITAIFKN